jgi:hypothetical protein
MQAGDEPAKQLRRVAPIRRRGRTRRWHHPRVRSRDRQVAGNYRGEVFASDQPFSPDTIGGCPRCKTFVLARP